MMIVRVIWVVIGLVIGVIGWRLVGMDISDINTSAFWGILMVSVSSYIITASAIR